jgi:lysophospholipase L1-like esterase
MSNTHPARRTFLGTTVAALAGVGLSGCAGPPAGAIHSRRRRTRGSLVVKGDVVLFQGDSITDASRNRELMDEANSQPAFGSGYAWLAACGLLVDRPGDQFATYNRGISGNKVFQLADRWEEDCLALKPDVLSILIGVNDIWHARNGSYDGTAEVYERDYDALLRRTRAALPDVAIVVCEPFVLRCGAVDETWIPEFDEYRAAARRVARDHAAAWVGFQSMFDEAIRYAPPEHWAGDGVHPTSAGAALMAQAWLRAVGA